MGYTPVFDGVFKGTLHGKWPDTGLWLCLLAMSDKNGEIDCTPQYIASVTGLTADQVVQCIDRFMQPDQYSRTQEHEGRRMALIDPARPWGWRILNHGKYREKARKAAYDSDRTASGIDAARKAAARSQCPDVSRDVPRSPDATRDGPLSDSDANTDTDRDKTGGDARKRASTARRIPDDFTLTPERRKVAEAEKADPDREFAKFTDHWRAASGANARKHDWDATWRNWCRKAAEFRRGPAQASAPAQTWRPSDDEDDHAYA